MINDILREYEACTFDFRRHACPHDPLADRFAEWVAYYRMKWAIARVLKPASILEIGVRYGYSARAFLEASPQGAYLGLDSDVSTFGGQTGALEWAANSLKAFDAKFMKVDSQNLQSLPGEVFDLVHVDGQQDGDGTFNDLNLVLGRARFVLLDGYFWSRENFFAANEWMSLNRAAIDWTVTIPGYAGELLIKPKWQQGSLAGGPAAMSAALATCYSKQYYLTDCGGFSEWQRSRGKALGDPRLRILAEVAHALTTPAKVMDLGAGRGELTRHFAKAGSKVVAVDYSQDAISLVEQTFEGEDKLRGNAVLVCDSVTNPSIYRGRFDVAVASDIVEHLAPSELDVMYDLVARHLEPDGGALVVHTAPNLWNYRYEHARQRRIARWAGYWLPGNRRTYFERLMHINEQSPRVLRKQLKRHFPHVLLWFAGADGEDSLCTRFRIGDMRRATSLFAVASHQPIDADAIRFVLRMAPLSKTAADLISLRVLACPKKTTVNGVFEADVILSNGSAQFLASSAPHPFRLSYHWEPIEGGRALVFEGCRSPLVPACRPGTDREYAVSVTAPDVAGRYALKIVPVQEGVRWHESANEIRTIVDVQAAA